MKNMKNLSFKVGTLCVGICCAITINNTIISLSKQKDGIYIINKLPLLYDASLKSVKNGNKIAVLDPYHDNELIVYRLIGKNGEWIKCPNENEYKELNQQIYPVFVPKGYCWVHAISSDEIDGSMPIDSRSFGPLPLGLVKGSSTFKIKS